MSRPSDPTASAAPADPRRGWVLHVDLDQFLAAVEVQRHPELAGRPVVVGGRGDPTERGVVATASYEAREHGVRSGMPLRVAARRCPAAVFLPADHPTYEAASAEVMATLRGLRWDGDPVVVEVLGWDEAFVALAPSAGPRSVTDPPTPVVDFAAQLQAEVVERTGLHCSVGLGDNRLRAKIATDLGKPRGRFVLTAATWLEVMGERPTDALWGIGRRTASKLAGCGITTVAELAAADPDRLASELGPTMGPWYVRLGRGQDSRRVDPTPYVARGHGREETFQVDLEDPGQIEAALRRLAHAAAADIAREGRPALRVGIKVRHRPFATTTRSCSLPQPSADPEVLADAAVALLGRITSDRPVRLLGVRLEMVPPEAG